MNVITKEMLELMLKGLTADYDSSEYGSITYWQSRGGMNLLKSMLEVYYP